MSEFTQRYVPVSASYIRPFSTQQESRVISRYMNWRELPSHTHRHLLRIALARMFNFHRNSSLIDHIISDLGQVRRELNRSSVFSAAAVRRPTMNSDYYSKLCDILDQYRERVNLENIDDDDDEYTSRAFHNDSP